MTKSREPGFYWAVCEFTIRYLYVDEFEHEVRTEIVEVDERGNVLFMDGARGTVELWGPRVQVPAIEEFSDEPS